MLGNSATQSANGAFVLEESVQQHVQLPKTHYRKPARKAVQGFARLSIQSRARRTSGWPLKSSSPEQIPKMWRLLSSLMARRTRFAKRESWSFEGCSLAAPVRLSICARRSRVSCLSSSDRVSVRDRLSILVLLSPSDFGSLSAMTNPASS
jgi:hypothetical protein